MNASIINCEISVFEDAATAPAGCRNESSPAKFGPVIKPSLAGGIPKISVTTSVMRSWVLASIPFSVLMTGLSLGKLLTQPDKFSRKDCAGIASTSESPKSKAS